MSETVYSPAVTDFDCLRLPNMGDDDYSSLETEIETLKAIYIHELEIDHDDRDRPSSVTVHLYPATADNITEQFVRLSLILQIPYEYPLDIPEISIRNTRGLSDEEIESIYQSTIKLAEERKGSAMLFELIEVAKEHLTVINIPSCECAICLYGFVHDDALTKTECFHYFHSYCLARYVCHTLEKKRDPVEISVEDNESDRMVPCPVCRLPIFFPFSDKNFPPPAESENVDISISTEQRKIQEEMQELFIKQKEKGGIIDLEAEKNKFLLEISTVQDAAANRSDADTVNQQIEQCVMEKKDFCIENAVKTAKVQTSSEKLHKNENHLGNSSNEDKNRQITPPFRNSYKQHGRFPNQSERNISLEHNLEFVNSTKESENKEWNGNKKEVVDGIDEEEHISDAVDESQEIISSCKTDQSNSQRDEILHRGMNRRPFRGNHRSRQIQNQVRHLYDKRLQINEYKYNSEKENNFPIQTTTNYLNTEVDRKLDSRNDRSEQNEVNKRSKSPRKSIYKDNRSVFRKYNERHQMREERGEYSKEHEEKPFGEVRSIQKNTIMSRRTERGGRQYSGYYARNYKKDHKFQHSFKKHAFVENSQTEKYTFQDQSTNKQNIEFELSTNDILRKDISSSQTMDMSQNHKANESNAEQDLEHFKRKGENSNSSKEENSHGIGYSDSFKSKKNFRKEYSEVGNVDCVQKDHRDNMKEEITIQEMRGHAELNERKHEDGKESKREEKYVNNHYRNYRGRKNNNHRGFQNRYVDKQTYSYEGRKNYNRQHPNMNHLQTTSKDNTNNKSDTEFSKGEMTMQQDSQLDHAVDVSGILKTNKKVYREMHKNVNSYDRDNYRAKSRGHEGFYYRTNERRTYNSEVQDKCNRTLFSKELKNKNDIVPTEEEQQLKKSELRLIENDRAETGKQSQKVNHSILEKGLAKTPTKHRNIYFHPKSRGNFHNNNYRTINDTNYHTQQRHRDTRENTNNNDAREHPVKAACQTDTTEHSSHR